MSNFLESNNYTRPFQETLRQSLTQTKVQNMKINENKKQAVLKEFKNEKKINNEKKKRKEKKETKLKNVKTKPLTSLQKKDVQRIQQSPKKNQTINELPELRSSKKSAKKTKNDTTMKHTAGSVTSPSTTRTTNSKSIKGDQKNENGKNASVPTSTELLDNYLTSQNQPIAQPNNGSRPNQQSTLSSTTLNNSTMNTSTSTTATASTPTQTPSVTSRLPNSYTNIEKYITTINVMSSDASVELEAMNYAKEAEDMGLSLAAYRLEAEEKLLENQLQELDLAQESLTLKRRRMKKERKDARLEIRLKKKKNSMARLELIKRKEDALRKVSMQQMVVDDLM